MVFLYITVAFIAWNSKSNFLIREATLAAKVFTLNRSHSTFRRANPDVISPNSRSSARVTDEEMRKIKAAGKARAVRARPPQRNLRASYRKWKPGREKTPSAGKSASKRRWALALAGREKQGRDRERTKSGERSGILIGNFVYANDAGRRMLGNTDNAVDGNIGFWRAGESERLSACPSGRDLFGDFFSSKLPTVYRFAICFLFGDMRAHVDFYCYWRFLNLYSVLNIYQNTNIWIKSFNNSGTVSLI